MSAVNSSSSRSETAGGDAGAGGSGSLPLPRLPPSANALDYTAWESRARSYLTSKGFPLSSFQSPLPFSSSASVPDHVAAFKALRTKIAAADDAESVSMLDSVISGTSTSFTSSRSTTTPSPADVALAFARKTLSLSQRAYGTLHSMLPTELTAVADKDSTVEQGYAYSLWLWLSSRFQRTAVDMLPELWMDFVSLAKGDEKWADYKAKVDDSKRRIEAAGDTIPHGLYAAKLVYMLPSGYQSAVNALIQSGKLASLKAIVWADVRAAMESQERQAERSAASAGDGEPVPIMAFVGRGTRCFTCGESGHFASDCRAQTQTHAQTQQRKGRTPTEGQRHYRRPRGIPGRGGKVPGGALANAALTSASELAELPATDAAAYSSEESDDQGRDSAESPFGFMICTDELLLSAATSGLAEADDKPAPLRRLRRPGEGPAAAASQGKGGPGARSAPAPQPLQSSSLRATGGITLPGNGKPSPTSRALSAGGRPSGSAAGGPVSARTDNLRRAAAAPAENERQGSVLHNLKRSWWGIDTMASVHVTGNRGLLFNVRRSPAVAVTIADGREVVVNELGVLRVNVALRGRDTPTEVTVRDVYYHASVGANLLSYGKIAASLGTRLNLENGANYLETREGAKISLSKIANVYILKPGGSAFVASATECATAAAYAALSPTANRLNEQLLCAVGVVRSGERIVTSVRDFLELHLTLNHLGFDGIVKACALGKVDGLGAVRASTATLAQARRLVSSCRTCARANAKRQPLAGVGLDRGNEPGDMLHMDTFDVKLAPEEHATCAFHYGLVLKDPACDLILFEPLKSKADAGHAITRVIRWYETARGHRLKRLRCDLGSEFIKEQVGAFCSERGIETRASPTGRKELNGLSERLVQELKKLFGALMHQCGLPGRFWHYAAAHAVHVWNRTKVSSDTNVTPYESVYGRRPDVRFLAPFGCDAFVRVLDRHRVGNTLAERGQPAIYLGHDRLTNAPLLYNMRTSKTCSSIDVEFREGSFAHARALGSAPDSEERRSLKEAWTSDELASDLDHMFEGFDVDLGKGYVPTEADRKELASLSAPLPLQPAVVTDAETTEEFAVKGILGRTAGSSIGTRTSSRFPFRRSDRTKYLVDWEGDYSPSWEPYANLRGSADELVDAFDSRVELGQVTLDEQGKVVDAESAQPVDSTSARTSDDRREHERLPEESDGDHAMAAFVMNAVCSDSPPAPVLAPAVTAPPALASADLLPDCSNPRYEDAVAGPDGALWEAAAAKEIASCVANDTWEEVARSSLPPGANVISSKFVCKVKSNERGEPTERKVRLTPRGFEQKSGVDYDEIFAPTGRYRSHRIVLSLAARLGHRLEQLDVPSAFLKATLKETIYMTLPAAYKGRKYEVVLRLIKALYGLKQAPREWYLLVSAFLIDECGYAKTVSDQCLFWRKSAAGRLMLVFLFVDDFNGSLDPRDQAEWDAVKQKLFARFQVKDLGETKWFLGMALTRDAATGAVKLDQSKYITDMAKRFGLGDGDPARLRTFATPATVRSDNATADDEDERDGGDEPVDQQRYMELIGSLMYAAITTRLDVAYMVSRLARHLLSPRRRHLSRAMRVLRYLVAHKHLGLEFRPPGDPSSPVTVDVWSDSDWAGERSPDPAQMRKSTTGWVGRVDGNVVSWQSKLQKNVARSSCTAEVYAACSGAEEILYLRGLLGELGLCAADASADAPAPASPLRIDNSSAIDVIKNGVRSSERVKHVEVHYAWVTDEYEQGKFLPAWVPSQDNLADILTKPLGVQPFQLLRNRLMA